MFLIFNWSVLEVVLHYIRSKGSTHKASDLGRLHVFFEVPAALSWGDSVKLRYWPSLSNLYWMGRVPSSWYRYRYPSTEVLVSSSFKVCYHSATTFHLCSEGVQNRVCLVFTFRGIHKNCWFYSRSRVLVRMNSTGRILLLIGVQSCSMYILVTITWNTLVNTGSLVLQKPLGSAGESCLVLFCFVLFSKRTAILFSGVKNSGILLNATLKSDTISLLMLQFHTVIFRQCLTGWTLLAAGWHLCPQLEQVWRQWSSKLRNLRYERAIYFISIFIGLHFPVVFSIFLYFSRVKSNFQLLVEKNLYENFR